MREGGWRVINFACSLGRSTQSLRRREEALAASSIAGFELHEPASPIALSGGDDLRVAEERLVEEFVARLQNLAPEIVVGPSPHDGHHGHEVVGRATRRAIEALPAGSRPRWWMWEIWSMLPAPTLYVPIPNAVNELAKLVLQAHEGELERNDYEAALSAQARLAAAFGVERVFGWGAPRSGDRYAELLMEVLCDSGEGWPLAAPRQLNVSDPLADAVKSNVDIAEWLASPSPRSQLFSEPWPERGTG